MGNVIQGTQLNFQRTRPLSKKKQQQRMLTQTVSKHCLHSENANAMTKMPLYNGSAVRMANQFHLNSGTVKRI